VGGTLAYPEMKTVGDIDNAVISLVFENGTLGSVELSRNAVFGYDIRAEVWGTKGSLQIGYFRETPILLMTREGISHDVVPHFMERFGNAYLAQIQDFVSRVLAGARPSITAAASPSRWMTQRRSGVAATTRIACSKRMEQCREFGSSDVFARSSIRPCLFFMSPHKHVRNGIGTDMGIACRERPLHNIYDPAP
jgi:predicted dehydrogenase